MSRGEYECLLGDDLFPDALSGLIATEEIIWESMIWSDSRSELESLRDEIVSLGYACDSIIKDSPKVGQFAFAYRIQTTVDKSDWLVKQLGDLYDIEHKYLIRGTTFSLRNGVGRGLL